MEKTLKITIYLLIAICLSLGSYCHYLNLKNNEIPILNLNEEVSAIKEENSKLDEQLEELKSKTILGGGVNLQYTDSSYFISQYKAGSTTYELDNLKYEFNYKRYVYDLQEHVSIDDPDIINIRHTEVSSIDNDSLGAQIFGDWKYFKKYIPEKAVDITIDEKEICFHRYHGKTKCFVYQIHDGMIDIYFNDFIFRNSKIYKDETGKYIVANIYVATNGWFYKKTSD